MAEESDAPDSGSGTGPDPSALALALGGASREEADSFLKAQRKLIAKQSHHLDEQFKRLRMGVIGDRLSIALKALTAFAGLAIAGFIGIMMWNAAHDDGLVIEAFSVPPDFAARGLSGQVVAGELLGNLSAFQAQSQSVRAASSYTNNWGDDIKVEIPETGVSIGEFNRFLQAWLGHETHITGAVYRTANGIAVTARVGSDTAPTITGSDADLDQILHKMSEAIYRTTQPYRFAQYMFAANGFAPAEIAQKAIIANGSPQDRFWAYNGLVTMYASQFDFEKAAKAAKSASALRPNSSMPYFNLGRSEMIAQHDEAALAASEKAIKLGRDPDINQQAWATAKPWIECLAAKLQGDFMRAVDLCQQAQSLPEVANTHIQARLLLMPIFAALHDGAALREEYADLPPTDDPLAAPAGYEALNESALGHWAALLDKRAVFESNLAKLPYSFFFNPQNFHPAVAYGLAISGDMAGAQAEIGKTPADCDVCLRMRGRIDALEKNWDGASGWFARAAQHSPSTPFAFTDWGRMWLDKGDADAAIAKFTIANQKGPHFADPLEMWGEALMAKKDLRGAAAKFEAAAKYAPNWGRLHLKWGEALNYSGKKDEARKEFAKAATLDLTADEKKELGGHLS